MAFFAFLCTFDSTPSGSMSSAVADVDVDWQRRLLQWAMGILRDSKMRIVLREKGHLLV